LAYFAYGINVYEYFFENRRPDWDKILKGRENKFYYFAIAEVPAGADRSKIKSFELELFLQNMKRPLEVRSFDFKTSPVFAEIFAEADNYAEIEKILSAKMEDYIR